MKRLTILFALAALVCSCEPRVKKLDANPEVHYYIVGRINTKEIAYGTAPFRVKVTSLNPKLIEEPVTLKIIDEEEFQLSYSTDEQSVEQFGMFNQEIKNNYMQLTVAKTASIDSSTVKSLVYISYQFIVKGEE